MPEKRKILGKQATSAAKQARQHRGDAKRLVAEAREHDRKSRDTSLSKDERGLHSFNRGKALLAKESEQKAAGAKKAARSATKQALALKRGK